MQTKEYNSKVQPQEGYGEKYLGVRSHRVMQCETIW